MRIERLFLNFVIPLFILSNTVVTAQVTIPKIFSSNMVLQQNTEVNIWGWANPGDTILITGSWNNTTVKAITGDNTKWLAKLNTPAAKTDGTFYSVTIKGTNTITLSNVLIGEVWLLSGQSNMEMPLQGWGSDTPVEGSAEAIATANFPNIRLLTVNRVSAAEPQKDITNNDYSLWTKCSPNTAKWFSAVGFFFGRELHQKLNIPIGLVASSWGGSSCETWAEESSLDFVKDYANGGPWQPTDNNDNQTPTVLYNGMIAPLVPFNFAGVCWYQGETNSGRPEQLTELFPAMIEGWRNIFQKENLPFYYVQLAPYGNSWKDNLPIFWEAQANALNLHDTEMASTIDAGDSTNIHPARKEPVGYRLAQKALANVYGQSSLEYAGPRYKSHSIEGDKIRITYTHTGSGLKAVNGDLRQFEIAGANNVFYKADAVIDGDEILVSSPQVATPKNVRYAWDKNATGSLYNNEDFPATPFRTNPASYIKDINSELLIGSEIIKEGETVQLRWTTIGGDEITLNGNSVAYFGTLEVLPDTTTTYILSASKNGDTIVTAKTVYVIQKELNSWAKNKTVTASSSSTAYKPAFAVDENFETKWRSNYLDKEWITVDLGETVPVNLVILHWDSDYAKKYEIQVSDDNQNWTTIFTENNGNGEIDFISELNKNGRFVRMQGVKRSIARGYNLFEFKVYSTEFRQTGTLLDKNNKIMRGTPMVLGKKLSGSVQFATNVNNWTNIRNNGYNTIRICWVDPWYKNHEYDHWTVSEVIPYFDKCVQNATEAGMNIIINFHNVGAQQEFDTEYLFELEKEFWDSIAPRYKNNNLVYYEIANEPTFKTDDYLKPVFKQNLMGIYKDIRKAAPEREILMFSFSTIANEIIEVIEDYKDSIEWNKTSVAYHMYNSNSSEAVRTLMAYHRVICTEWNYDHVGKQDGKEYIQQVDGFKQNSQTLENIGSGWIDWRDWNDTTLNELIDTLIFDAKIKDYWWGEPVEGLAATGIRISQRKDTLNSGYSKQLTAFVYPALAENQNISWSSSNRNHVSVDATGLITAKATQSKTATITATSADGGFKATCDVTVIPPEKKGAYPDNVPHKIPGTINSTHYDLGGEGTGYHDFNPENLGNGIRQEQGVDTEYRIEEGSIGGIQTGEWLEYTIDVAEEGNYTFEVLFASPGRFGKFHVEIDDEDKTGEVGVAPSSNYNTFKPTIIEDVSLKKGVQILRIFFDYAMYNMGTITIKKSDTSAAGFIEIKNSVKIFPNPVNDKLQVSGQVLFSNYSIKTITGQTVTTGNLYSNQTIDTQQVKPGNYLLILENKEFVVIKKLVKY